MSEAPRPAIIPSADAVSPDILPDEPLEIVFADELSLEEGTKPAAAPDTAPLSLGQLDKLGAAMPGPEAAAAQSRTQQPDAADPG